LAYGAPHKPIYTSHLGKKKSWDSDLYKSHLGKKNFAARLGGAVGIGGGGVA